MLSKVFTQNCHIDYSLRDYFVIKTFLIVLIKRKKQPKSIPNAIKKTTKNGCQQKLLRAPLALRAPPILAAEISQEGRLLATGT